MSTANGRGPPFVTRNVPVCLPLKYSDREDFRYCGLSLTKSLAYDYFGAFSSHKWLAHNDFWTSYYIKLRFINPFLQDSHTQMTQTAKGNITEITKFALVRPAMHPRKRTIYRLIVISHKRTRKVCRCLLLRWWTHDHWHSPPKATSSSWYRLKPEHWKKIIKNRKEKNIFWRDT